MKSEREARSAIDRYADTVRRICFVYLKNQHDAEDVFQDVFLKYVLRDDGFASDEHEKAWLIRVTVNACKDTLKSFFRRKTVPLDDLLPEPFYNDSGTADGGSSDVLEAVLALPEKYRTVIYLFYYENYTAPEIAKILRKNENTIYTWLARARTQLKESLGGEPFEG